jgi:5,10-methylenetetrahydromethanopterin reductase
MSTPGHIELAERLGYRRAWCYDSPAVLADVWMVLALAAVRTTRIGLGPGVLIPSLRHPMVTAAAISTLETLAPGRVVVGVGSGFTGRVSLGERPMRWADVEAYLRALRGLLRGETVSWHGRELQMLHSPDAARLVRSMSRCWWVPMDQPDNASPRSWATGSSRPTSTSSRPMNTRGAHY